MSARLRSKPAPAVCVLGGESSGKTTLSIALHHVLTHSHGLRVLLVPEYLRGWCSTQQRAPRAHEQAAIANEQSRRIKEARSTPGTHLVIADTSALTIATYSALYFADQGLLPNALNAQSAFDITLLMGLDLPWQPDGLLRDGSAYRSEADTLLRREMQGRGIPFQTVYGSGEQRLQNTLRALTPLLAPLLGQAPVATDAWRTEGRPGWQCEACSDPDCEHRLFSRLLPQNTSARDKP